MHTKIRQFIATTFNWNITLTVADGALLLTTSVVPVDSTAVVPLAAEF